MGMSSNITSMGLVVDVKKMVLRGNSSTSLWDLGTNAYTFDKIYTKTFNFGSTGYIGMDANEHLLLGSQRIDNALRDGKEDYE